VAKHGRVIAATWGAITDHLAPDAQGLTLDSAGTFSLTVFLHLFETYRVSGLVQRRGERRPTGASATNRHKACAVGRPLHWVVGPLTRSMIYDHTGGCDAEDQTRSHARRHSCG